MLSRDSLHVSTHSSLETSELHKAFSAASDVPKSKLCVNIREARNVVMGRFFVKLKYGGLELKSKISRESAFPLWKEELVFERANVWSGSESGAEMRGEAALKALGTRTVRIDDMYTLEVLLYRKSKWGADHQVGRIALDLTELRMRRRRAENWFALRQKGQSRIVENDEAATPEILIWLEFRHTEAERFLFRRKLHEAVVAKLKGSSRLGGGGGGPFLTPSAMETSLGTSQVLMESSVLNQSNQNNNNYQDVMDKGYGSMEGVYYMKVQQQQQQQSQAKGKEDEDEEDEKSVGEEDDADTINAAVVSNEILGAYREATTTFHSVAANDPLVAAMQSAPLEGSTTTNEPSVYDRDWELNELLQFNNRFQDAVEVLNSDAWELNPNGIIKAAQNLITVSQDFLFSARTYGKIIISERFLPDDKKTIRPLPAIGGKIGGIKYVHGGVFYKFALPDNHIITSVEDAAKVAGHELRGCMCYYNCAIPSLAVPLMCLVDYKGYRLIAITVLPIDKATLVGGTSDAGRHIHSSDFVLNRKLQKAAQVLNLKPHKVRGHTLYSACDLEGHFNPRDGRHYLLDFSRVMPPSAPPKGNSKSGSIFVRLLRPEFVAKYRTALCSDAFSGFRDGSNNRNEKEIIRACKDLSWMIPRFAAELSEHVEQKLQDPSEDLLSIQTSLSRMIHAKGINMRYLGQIYTDATTHSCRMLLLIEMASRTVKVLCRRRMRQLMEQLTFPLEQPYIEAVVEILNGVFGERKMWRENIIPMMSSYFGVAFPLQGNDRDDEAAKTSTPLPEVAHPTTTGTTKQDSFDPYDELGSSQSLSSSGVSEKKTLAPRAASSVNSTKPSVAAGDESGEEDEPIVQPASAKATQQPSGLFATLRNVFSGGGVGGAGGSRNRDVPVQPVLASIPDMPADPAPALPPPRIDDPFGAIHQMEAGTSLLFMRIVAQMRLSFSERVTRNIEVSLQERRSATVLSKRQAFDVSDLRELGERVKPLNIIPEAQGYVFVNKAKSAITVSDELHYYGLAISCFQEALAGNTISKSVLRSYANTLMDVETTAGRKLDLESSPQARRILELYTEALRYDPNDAYTLGQYGRFLAKCGLVEEAKLAFLESIFNAPRSGFGSVQRYSTLLQQTKESDLADEIFAAWKAFEESVEKK